MFTKNLARHTWIATLAIVSLTLIACGGEDAPAKDDNANASLTASLPASLFMTDAPEGVQPIASLKTSAKEGDEVVVRVVVGGSDDPIVKGRASAAIIDAAIENPCNSDDDHCKTPWDYCCTPQEEITKNRATLQVTDQAGAVLKTELAPRIQPMSILIVKGIVGPRPDDQVLTINAQSIYIETEAK